MKRYIIIFLCLIIYSGIASQPLPDSVKKVYNAAKTDAEKGKCLISYLLSLKNDSSIFKNHFRTKQLF
jgi:hypothetical protein